MMAKSDGRLDAEHKLADEFRQALTRAGMYSVVARPSGGWRAVTGQLTVTISTSDTQRLLQLLDAADTQT